MTDITQKNNTHKNNTPEEFEKWGSIEERLAHVGGYITKYPGMLPVVVYKASHSRLHQISNFKFLVPDNLTLGQFINYIIRKRLECDIIYNEKQALFIFVKTLRLDKNNKIIEDKLISPAMSSSIGSIYEDHKSCDGFLRLIYTEENTFG